MPKYLNAAQQGSGRRKTFLISFGAKLKGYSEDTLEGLLLDSFSGSKCEAKGDGEFLIRRGTYASLVWAAAESFNVQDQIVKIARRNDLILALIHGPCNYYTAYFNLELR